MFCVLLGRHTWNSWISTVHSLFHSGRHALSQCWCDVGLASQRWTNVKAALIHVMLFTAFNFNFLTWFCELEINFFGMSVNVSMTGKLTYKCFEIWMVFMFISLILTQCIEAHLHRFEVWCGAYNELESKRILITASFTVEYCYYTFVSTFPLRTDSFDNNCSYN